MMNFAAPLAFFAFLALLASGGSKAGASTTTTTPKSADPRSAASLGKRLSDDIKRKAYDYARSWCREFQAAVGLAADGIYGPDTASALRRYVPDAPKALFAGAGAKPAAKPAANPAAKPLSAAPRYVAPGSAPKGAAQPGTPPAGAQPPGARPASPATLTISKPQIRPATPAERAQAKRAAPAKNAVNTRVTKPTAKRGPTPLPSLVPAQTTPAQGAPAVKASPELEPHRGSLPAGYDPAKARARARAIAAHLAKKGPASYSRVELRTWQTHAGLRADGLYGGSSRGALVYYGVSDPPRPFSAPVATLPYVPPEQRLS